MTASIKSFTVDPKSIQVGGTATFKWEVENATATTTIAIEGLQDGLSVPAGDLSRTFDSPSTGIGTTYKLLIADTAVPDFYESEQVTLKVVALKRATAPAAALAKPNYLKPGPLPAVAGEAFPQFSANVQKTDAASDIAIGHNDRARKRLRIHFHLLPVEANWLILGEDLKKAIRKRALKWVRRVYAQANIGLPKNAVIEIEDVDPGPDNTLSICGTVYDRGYLVCHRPSGFAKDGAVISGSANVSVEGNNYKLSGGGSWTKNPAAGRYIRVSGFATAGNNGRRRVVSATNDVIEVEFAEPLTDEAASAAVTIAVVSEVTIKIKPTGAAEDSIRIPLEADQSFLEVAQSIHAAVAGAGFEVTAPTSHLSDLQHETSHDLVIPRKQDGTAIERIGAEHDDSEFGSWWKIDETDNTKHELPANARKSPAVFEVPSLKDLGGEDGFHGGCPRQRRLLRLGRRDDSRIDIFIAPKGTINGRAYAVYQEIGDANRKPSPPLRNAAYLVFWSTGSNGVVLGNLLDVSPFTLPHEIGHVLADTGHNVAKGDLMHGTWAKDNSAYANKRIYGKTLLVGSLNFETEAERPNQDMQEDMHTRNPGMLEDW